MANLKNKFNAIMQDLEQNIKNKDDLEYIKSQVYNISMLFLDEMDKLAEINLNRMNVLIDREKELGKRISSMEKVISNIEKEIFVNSDYDFEIICPYCNEEFVEDFTDGIKSEVRCPECDNIIELDWHEEDECGCGCNHHDCDDDCEDCGDCNCEECDNCDEEKANNDNNEEDDM